MKVFKFGGASANSVERIKKIPSILQKFKDEKILIVISAMGKTTNALEKVVEAFYKGKNEEALLLFQTVKRGHLTTAKYLLVKKFNPTEKILIDLFTEVEWLLHDKPIKSFDYYYDQIVCIGELLSTVIISAFLNEEGLLNEWIDVRDVLRTDENFRDANIDWDFTELKINEIILPSFSHFQLVVTQGFIGATMENESTTLGREGSDYSAAVFANLLNAESLTIWKDVEGVMNADPKKFPDSQFISELSYEEVIEMAFYGAQVIHPKTIKPLQNKKIPLLVKCFLDPDLPGTLIQQSGSKNLPPIIVIKENQVLMLLQSKDFSFVGEKLTADLYNLFSETKTRPNLIQSAAVNLQVCIDDIPEKFEKLASLASGLFDVQVEKNLTLLTIRHDDGETLNRLIKGKEILLRQQSKFTVQVLMK